MPQRAEADGHSKDMLRSTARATARTTSPPGRTSAHMDVVTATPLVPYQSQRWRARSMMSAASFGFVLAEKSLVAIF